MRGGGSTTQQWQQPVILSEKTLLSSKSRRSESCKHLGLARETQSPSSGDVNSSMRRQLHLLSDRTDQTSAHSRRALPEPRFQIVRQRMQMVTMFRAPLRLSQRGLCLHRRIPALKICDQLSHCQLLPLRSSRALLAFRKWRSWHGQQKRKMLPSEARATDSRILPHQRHYRKTDPLPQIRMWKSLSTPMHIINPRWYGKICSRRQQSPNCWTNESLCRDRRPHPCLVWPACLSDQCPLKLLRLFTLRETI